MTRREFSAVLLAAASARALPDAQRPSMLVAPEDSFSGLPLLRARYSAGRRTSDDLAGWALSWALTREDHFAERAVSEMRKTRPPAPNKPSRSWVDYVQWSLAFDWLYPYAGLDSALKNRVAKELAEGAVTVAAEPEIHDPHQVSYHNYALRYLALVTFALAAIKDHDDYDERYRALRDRMHIAFDNVLDLTQLVTPEGSYHESLDYMRITWAPLALLAELRRTQTGIDPARRFTVFRNFGDTYLYKLLPNGTPSREGDNEYPLLDTRDTALLGYAVHRFKDPYSAWMLRKSGIVGEQWMIAGARIPLGRPRKWFRKIRRYRLHREIAEAAVLPWCGPSRDAGTAGGRDSTWIEFDCGPYFAKHQHLDQNQFYDLSQGLSCYRQRCRLYGR